MNKWLMLTQKRGLNLFCLAGIGSTSRTNMVIVPRFFIYKYFVGAAGVKQNNMKKFLLFICCAVLFITGCNSYKPIGKFTMISNRNVDSKSDYVLLKQYSSGDDKEKKKSRFETIEDAIDNTVKIVGGGEFLKNVKIYSVNNKYYAVEGDVWGISNQGTPNVDYKGFKIGDRVQWKEGFFTKTGVIVSINVNDNDYCVIKDDRSGKAEKVKYKDLMSLGQSSNSDQVVDKKSPFGDKKSPFGDNNSPFGKNKTESKVENQPVLFVGDNVVYKNESTGNMVEGKIISINQNTANVEYPDPANPTRTFVVEKELSKLTKVEKQVVKEDKSEIKSDFKIGDFVAFKDETTGNYLKGEISSISKNIAFVEYPDPNNPTKTKEVGKDVTQLTKIEKPVVDIPVVEKKSIEVGDYVLFKKFDDAPALKGKVTQINQNTATVEYTDPNNSKTKEIELDIQKLTKTDK